MPRVPLTLLVSLLALLGMPAAALAADPVNTTPAAPSGWVASPYEVEIDGTDADGGPLTAEWNVNGILFAAPAPATATLDEHGVNTFETRIVDQDGNASPWRVETVRIDATNPTDDTDAGTTDWRSSVTTVTLYGSDTGSGVDRMEWQLDGGLTQSGPHGTVVSVNSDGVHTLRTRAVDAVGNASNWRTHTIRVDTLNPTDTTSAPAGWQTDALDVVVAGEDAHSGVSSVTWRYENGAETTVPGSTTVRVSADGIHVLETMVTDVAGRTSGWKRHTIRIDKSAPDNQTAAAPTAWQTGDYVVPVQGADSVSGVREVQWRVNAGAITSGSPGIQARVTGTGTHQLETRVVDNAGNTSGWRLDTVRIDALPPANTTPTPPSPAGNPYTVAVTGADDHSPIARVEWRVDDGPLQSGANGATATVTGNGPHTLATQVYDSAGNASGWRTDSFTIDAVSGDTTPPTDTTTTVSSAWRRTAVSVTVAATDAGSGVASVEWRLGGQAVRTEPGASFALTVSGEGVHHLETRAWDHAGNRSTWRLQTIRIDTSVPEDTTSFPAGWQRTTAFTLTGRDAVSEIADIEYTIDGGPVQHANSGDPLAVPGDGVYAIRHRVIDAADHATDWVESTLRVDRVEPANTSSVPSSDWRTEALELPLSGTDNIGAVTMQWRLDGGEPQSGDTAVVDQDGEFLLETRAVDEAGNASAWQGGTVRVDRTAPVNTTPAPAGGWRASAYTVTLSGSDGTGSGVDVIEHTVDGGAVSTAASVTVTGDGVHTLRSRVVDLVGHASAWREDVIRIDSARPTAALACGSSAWRTSAACTVTASGGPSGLPTLTLSRNGGAPTPVAAGSTVTVATHGVTTLALRAVDGAGNTATAAATVRVDRVAPTASVSCTPAGEVHTCRVTAADSGSGLAGVYWNLDGGPWTTVAPGASFSAAEGSVRLLAVDAAGNRTTTAPVKLAPQATVRSGSVPVNLKGRGGEAGLVGALDAARDAQGTVLVDLRPLALGAGRFRVVLRVKSGSRSARKARTYKVGALGTLPRIVTRLTDATERATVTLTVKRRAGKRWKSHASARLVLAK